MMVQHGKCNEILDVLKGALFTLFLSLFLLIPTPLAFFNARRKRKQLDIQKNINAAKALSWNSFEELVAKVNPRN
jgi:hypothetical protein